MTFLFWRYLTLALGLGFYLIIKKRFSWPGWRAAGHAITLGILAHGIWLSCVSYALLYGVPAGRVALVIALQPLLTHLFSKAFTGESTSFIQWMGSFLGFSGVFLTVSTRVDWDQPVRLAANWLPLISVIAITLASLLERRRIRKNQATHLLPSLSLFYQSLGTAIAVSFPAMFIEGLATQWSISFSLAMLWLILGVSLGAYSLMWKLIKVWDAGRVATLFYIGPPLTMFMSWLMFGDKISPWDGVGILMVAAGVTLSYTHKPRQRES